MRKVRQAARQEGGLPRKKAVTVLGKQPDSCLWALGPNLLIDETTGENNHVVLPPPSQAMVCA